MAQITLTPEVQAVARKFLERLRDEGYNAEQLAEAARTWTHDYARGVRNQDQLEDSARKSSALPESFVTDNPYENTPELLTEQFERDLRISQPGLTDEQIAAELEGFGELPLDAMGSVLGLDPIDPDADLALPDSTMDPEAGLGAAAEVPIPDLSGPIDPGMTFEEETVTTEQFTPEAMAAAGWGNQERAAGLAAQKQPPAPTPAAPEATPGYERGWKDWTSLGLGLGGAALGALAPMIERDRGFEAQLRERAAGDTIARREGALAAGQLARGIRGASLGRRDISPALAMRNAQMAAARAGSDVMAQAAIASARERQAAQQQLADIRKARVQTQINAGLGALSQTGAWLAGQAASERQGAKDAAQLQATQERNRLQAEQNQLTRQALQGRGKR
jgi:hypothetical protein